MSQAFDELLAVMHKLRSPGGCPWDAKQTHKSILPYLIEECYEVVDAIERNDSADLKEELGDLLLQVVFHAEMASENGNFTIEDVALGISQKLIRRHPHVYGNTVVNNAGEVVKNWDAIKNEEKKHQKQESVLDSVPRAFPALMEAQKISKKAAKTGFDWKKPEDVFKKINEETAEVKKAIKRKNKKNIEEEVGDLLFCLVNLARKLKVDPEMALRKTNAKFRKRFLKMEKAASKKGKKLESFSLKDLDNLWEKAKK
ncbi:nucleoside triphosphate pyrophosphohydrolase [bacterium]|nr:nucleoside triphosphate pyrophosphohydrolase [bacterium]